MRLRDNLLETAPATDFDAFTRVSATPTGASHQNAQLHLLDALDIHQDLLAWSSTGSAAASAFSAAGFAPIVLPPLTPDQIRRKAELDIANTAPPFTRLDNSASDAEVDKKLADLEATVNQRANDYAQKQAQSIFGSFFGGRSDGLAKTYGDLTNAMKGDAAELANWKNLTHDQKVDLYNRVGHEANMEVKYNINIVYGDKKWSEGELNDLDAGLARLPQSLILDDDKLGNIRRYSALTDSSKNPVFAWTLGNGDIEFTDLGISSSYRFPKVLPAVAEVILHEIGHHFDNENPKWKEFMALSGWRDLGADTLFPTIKNGETAKGSALGITDDPNGDYVVSRQYNRTYVHKADAKFGEGDYTRQNPLDDFAETFMQYMVDPENLRKNAPEKYAFMTQFLLDRQAGPVPGRTPEID
jgi:hypothetical protein